MAESKNSRFVFLDQTGILSRVDRANSSEVAQSFL